MEHTGRRHHQLVFQSSFELTGYITEITKAGIYEHELVSKLFRAYGLYNIHIHD